MNRLAILLRTFLLFAILELQIGPRLFLPQAGDASSAQSRIVYYADFLVCAFILLLSLASSRKLGILLLKRIEILIFCFFGLISGIKAGIDLLVVIYYTMQFISSFLILYMVYKYDGIDALRHKLFIFFSFVIIAHAASFFIPSMSIAQSGELIGTYRGLSLHRGDLSFVLIVAVVIVLSSKSSFLAKAILVLMASAMLVMTKSAQGPILLLAAVGVMAVLHLPYGIGRYRGVLILFSIILLSIAIYALPDIIDEFLGIFSRDRSFTGRDRIWAMAIYLLKDLPTFGFGLNSFQNIYLPDDLLRQYRIDGIKFGSTHSAYIEVLYSFGLFGAIPFYFAALRQAILSLLVVFGTKIVENSSAVALTIFCVVGGITAAEKMFLPGMGWMAFMISMVLLDGERARHQSEIRELDTLPSTAS